MPLLVNDDFNSTILIDEEIQEAADKAQQDRPKHRRPEAMHLEPPNHQGHELQEKRVDQWDEKPQRQDREVEGQDHEHRSKDGVDYPQKKGRG